MERIGLMLIQAVRNTVRKFGDKAGEKFLCSFLCCTDEIILSFYHLHPFLLTYFLPSSASLVNLADSKGNTAAHYAAHAGHDQILQKLKTSGANFAL